METPWLVDGKFKDITEEEKGKLTTEQLSKYTTAKNADTLAKAILDLESKISEAQKGNVTVEDYEAFKTKTQESLDNIDIEQVVKDQIHQKHADLVEKLKKQGLDIKALKSSGGGLNDKEKKKFETLTRKQQFQLLLEKGMETEEYKRWFAGDNKGNTPMIDIKAAIGLESNHTGDVFVTEPVANVRDIPRMQPHMRDFLSVGTTDETKITYPEIENYTDIYTLGTKMLAENEEITDVTFESKENTSEVVRLGVSMSVSKRYFRGRSSVMIDHVISQIPDGISFKEDVQILHGDGSSNNLSGIITDARGFDLTPKSYTAGQIVSVASYDSGKRALLTFSVAHGLLSGDKITIANATEASYNATHEDILLIDEKSIVINLAYVAEATTAWTGTGLSYWYQSVEGAQEFDVLSAASSILEAGLYNANLVFVNPQTTKRLGTLKGDDGHYIGVSRDAAGRLNLDEIPIISIPVIPAGWFLIGDFSAKNIEIRDYTTMSIQFLEDVTTKRTNTVVILADEELHLVKYNPKWYIYDRFSTAKTQLETL